MFELDEILNDTPDYDDLEKLSLELAEFNYYYNTKKQKFKTSIFYCTVTVPELDGITTP